MSEHIDVEWREVMASLERNGKQKEDLQFRFYHILHDKLEQYFKSRIDALDLALDAEKGRRLLAERELEVVKAERDALKAQLDKAGEGQG